jgi:TIR domain
VSGVFINYRGKDSETAAALIDRELTARFGSDRVFLDCRSIPAGVDFAEELLGRLRACSVLLVVIGPRWLTLTDPAGQRLIDNPRDWVRREIVEAFARGMRVIPVLTDGVKLPAAEDLPQDIAGLNRRQYVSLRRRYVPVDLAFLVERITETDPELAELADRRQRPDGAPVDEAVRDLGPLFADVLADGFTGRGWLIEQIDGFLRDRPCGYLWVEGDAGVGKTTLAAHLVRERGWVGHFARLTRGGSARAGLRNLAGQLVRRYRLDDLAPGGLLPEQLFTPEGFEAMLARVAVRAGGPLVLVVDGADEAEPVAGAQPWGLPVELPPGVFVVGTYRTGHPPPRCAAPTAVVRIGARAPENVADMAAHVACVLRGPDLAGADVDRVAEQLVARCGGVWVYLRYVLAEIRQGVRSTTDLGDLPAELSRYYCDSLERWSQSAGWRGQLLPVVATLAIAGEPLPVPLLARLSGVDEAAVLLHCHSALRPFLSAVDDPLAIERGFELYHASLREFLTGVRPVGDCPDRDWMWWETLRRAAVAAHDRIAEHYVARFGGMDTGLARLADDPGLAAVDGGYPLRHLARHLVAASRDEDLHRLLRANGPAGQNRPGPTAWFAAHDRADTVEDYLADIAAARRLCEHSTDQALAAGLPAPSLVDEARYHVISASIASRTNALPVDLVIALVANRVWTVARAVAHARRLPTASARAHVLAVLAGCLPEDERPTVLDQALATATAIPSEYARAEVLLKLIPLVSYQRADLVAMALDAAIAIPGEHQRGETLADLAPWLSPDQLDAALAVAADIVGNRARARALTALAPLAPQDRRVAALDSAVAAASAICGEQDRAAALAELASRLSGAQLDRALAAACAITGHYRVTALAAVAVRLPSPHRETALADALTSASAAGADPTADAEPRADALATLVPHLPAAGAVALAAALAIPAPTPRARVLIALARHLPAAAAHALAAVAAIGAATERADAFAGLAPHLTERQLVDALHMIPSSPHARARWLTVIAPHLPADRREAAVRAAHRAANDTTGAPDRAEALTRLAPLLPAGHRAGALIAALAAATAVAVPGTLVRRDADTDRADRRDSLAGLTWPGPTDTHAIAVTAETWAAALTATSARLRSRTPARPRFDAAPDLSLSAVAAMRRDDARAAALAALGPCLHGDDLTAALALACAITDERARAAALAGLVPHLCDTAQLGRALAAAPYGDRTLLCTVVVRADTVVEDDAEFTGLVRLALRATSRDTCVALLAAALTRLAVLAGADAAARLGTALRDAHRWWP